MGLGQTIGGIVGTAIGARKQKEAAEKDRKRRMAMLDGMDWEPAYASDRAPTYQRSQSPVARAYLESLLNGTNPDATFSGSPNAALQKNEQQKAKNRMFGSPEQLKQKQDAYFAETPWAVTSPAQAVGGGSAGGKPVGGGRQVADPNTTFAMKYPLLAKSGMDADMFEQVKADSKQRNNMWSSFNEDSWRDRAEIAEGDQDAMRQFVDLYREDPNAAWKLYKKKLAMDSSQMFGA